MHTHDDIGSLKGKQMSSGLVQFAIAGTKIGTGPISFVKIPRSDTPLSLYGICATSCVWRI